MIWDVTIMYSPTRICGHDSDQDTSYYRVHMIHYIALLDRERLFPNRLKSRIISYNCNPHCCCGYHVTHAGWFNDSPSGKSLCQYIGPSFMIFWNIYIDFLPFNTRSVARFRRQFWKNITRSGTRWNRLKKDGGVGSTRFAADPAQLGAGVA